MSLNDERVAASELLEAIDSTLARAQLLMVNTGVLQESAGNPGLSQHVRYVAINGTTQVEVMAMRCQQILEALKNMTSEYLSNLTS